MTFDVFFVAVNAINRLEVESAPAVVFLKDPGVKPVVQHGMLLSLFAYVLHLTVQVSDLSIDKKVLSHCRHL